MATTVKQPSVNPTNKLTAATLTAIVMNLSRVLVQHFLPDFYDAALWAAIEPAIILAVGYYVKDKPNVPSDPDYERG